VTPVVLAAEILEVLLQQSSHADDPIGHALDLSEPLLIEVRVVQDLRCYPSPVYRRIGVEWSDKNLDLRVDSFLLVC